MVKTSPSDSIAVNWCHTVRCSTDASWSALESPIPLGPLDQLADPTFPIAVVFVYEQTSSSPDTFPIPLERFERSMSLLLDHYPHLSGRLQVRAADGSLEIARLGTGAHLFSAKCSSRLDDFQDVGHGRIMSLPGAGIALLPPFEATIEGVCREPMLKIQHTRFACGSVALGILVVHSLCDGDGFFQLVRDLAELYRCDGNGTPTLSRPPHVRSYLSDFSEKHVTREEKNAILATQPPLLRLEPAEKVRSLPSTIPSPLPPPNVGRIIRFYTRELSALKSSASDPAHPESWVSTFEALSAHLYQHIHRARVRLRKDSEGFAKYGELSPTDFLTTVNLRSKLGPPYFPPKYFPNGFVCVHTHVPPDVLEDGPLYKVASILHELTRNPPGLASSTEIMCTNKWVALQPDKRRIKQTFRYGSGCFVVTQWSKFDMYEGTTFDSQPTLVSPTFGPFVPMFPPDGLAIFLPTDDRGADRGAIDVGLSLSESMWEVLDQDKDFRRFKDVY